MYACAARAAARVAATNSTATTGGSVGGSKWCMYVWGWLNAHGGSQAVRAAGENLQICTLFFYT
jgi:hypothetical protein